MQYVSPYQSLAETYEIIRPGYPEALIDDVVTWTAIAGPAPLLEIGAGTGKATRSFLERGFSIDAVEPDVEMAALLKQKLQMPKLRLFVSPFEGFQPPGVEYPLIYCAQAFHWLDACTKFERCAELLAASGYLALFWYDPMQPVNSAAYQASERVKVRYFNSVLPTQTVSLDTREQEIQEAKEFTLVFRQQYDVTLRNTPEQALTAMRSMPSFVEEMKKLSATRQQDFQKEFTTAVKENGGILDTPMRYSLYLLQKK